MIPRILLVCVGITYFSSTADALSWKTIPPDPTDVLLGDNVTLEWDYQLDPGETTSGFFQVIWSRQESHGWNNLAVKSSLSGISILRDQGHVVVDESAKATFIIVDVREIDHTKFRCSIESTMSLTPTSIQLNVLIPATIVWISENQSFIEGGSVTLSCRVKGNPVPYVSWISPNGTLLKNATNDHDNTYTIGSLEERHVGTYRCRTQNVYGTDEKITYIYLPPSIHTITPTAQTVNETDTATIYCNATGLPAPSITWVKLDSGNIVGSGEQLVIHSIKRNASGTYQCRASNGVMGAATANSTINVQYSPSIRFISSYGPITENETLQLFCNATGNPEPAIRWSKTGDVTVLASGNFLTFQRLIAAHHGVYTCTADNGIGNIAMATSDIEVLVSPAIDASYPQTQIVIEGNSAVMFCNATGNPRPNITWTRNGGSGGILGFGEQLSIGTANRSDTGSYKCTADNGVIRTAQATLTLDVHYAPRIDRAPIDKTVNETDELSVYCNATGNPRPNITWIKRGSEVNGGRDITMGTGETLFFNKTRKEDRGVYSCVASNGVGVSKVNFTVNVHVFLAPTFDVIPQNTTVNETGTVTLRCNATGNPAPRITWRTSTKAGLVTGSGDVISIRDILRNNSGVYRCIASNGVGQDVSAHALVNVQFPPDISAPPEPIIVNSSNALNLYCNITGNPRPLVSWTKDDNFTIISQSYENVLTVDNVNKKSAGKYHCKATNLLGSATATVKVIVHYKPQATHLQSNATNSTIFSRSTTQLNCSADAIPPANSYIYYHNGNRISETSNGIYRIDFAELSDEGMYACAPANALGSGENAHINLTYKEPAEILSHSPNQVLREGDDLVLWCNATGYPVPQIRWSIVLQDSTTRIQTNTEALTITSVRRNNTGTYSCSASNNVGTNALATVNVSVQYGPEISLSSTTLSAWINKPTSLECMASGVPLPQISWSRPGQISISTSGDTITSLLSLSPSSSGDFGTFTCQARSSAGSDNDAIELIELVRPGRSSLIRVEPSDNKIQLIWTQPDNDGGSPISSYVASVRRKGESAWRSCRTSFTLCTIADVAITEWYSVRVYATNRVGDGQEIEVNVTVAEQEVRLLERTWSPLLNNKNSDNYTKLEKSFNAQMWSEYSQDSFLKGVGVTGFRSGSVITTFRLTYVDNITNIQENLKTKLNDGFLGNMKAELVVSVPGNTGAREASDSATIGSVISVLLVLILLVIVFVVWYRHRKRSQNVTIVESKQEDVEQNESYRTQAGDMVGPGDAWTTAKPDVETQGQLNEDEGIEMDMCSEARDGNISRLSTHTDRNSPRFSRPQTPIGKTRVHPCPDDSEAPMGDHAHREGVRTTQPASGLPTEYADIFQRSGTKDRLYAELAWLEKKGRPKHRTRLPSISAGSVPQRKYSILDILRDQQDRPRTSSDASQGGASTS